MYVSGTGLIGGEEFLHDEQRASGGKGVEDFLQQYMDLVLGPVVQDAALARRDPPEVVGRRKSRQGMASIPRAAAGDFPMYSRATGITVGRSNTAARRSG